MKTIKLVLYNKINYFDEIDFDNLPVWKEYKVPYEFNPWNMLLFIDNQNYNIITSKGNVYIIDKVIKFDDTNKEEYDKNEITCPVCGFELGDSWECENDEDELICECCGSKFAYTRNYEVTYDTEVIEVNYPISLREEFE